MVGYGAHERRDLGNGGALAAGVAPPEPASERVGERRKPAADDVARTDARPCLRRDRSQTPFPNICFPGPPSAIMENCGINQRQQNRALTAYLGCHRCAGSRHHDLAFCRQVAGDPSGRRLRLPRAPVGPGGLSITLTCVGDWKRCAPKPWWQGHRAKAEERAWVHLERSSSAGGGSSLAEVARREAHGRTGA